MPLLESVSLHDKVLGKKIIRKAYIIKISYDFEDIEIAEPEGEINSIK